MKTHAEINQLHREFWRKQYQSKIIERLNRRFEKNGVKLSTPKDFSDLITVTQQMLVEKTKPGSGVHPTELAKQLGHADWKPHIKFVLNWGGGRSLSQNVEEENLLLQLAELHAHEWKKIAAAYEKETGKPLGVQAARSAWRRADKRRR